MNVQTNFYPYFVSIMPVAGVISGDSIFNLPQGIYTICVTDSFGCTMCVVDTVLEDPTSVVSTHSENLKIYPNPVMDQLTIRCRQSCHGDYFISDLMGKVLLRGLLSEFKNEADLRSLSSGVYFITIKNVDSVTIKILKE